MPFVDPTPRKLKLRANGLINMRVRRGLMVKLLICEWCNDRPVKDFHHPDYGKPADGWWLCRSCHMKVHHGTIKLPDRGAA